MGFCSDCIGANTVISFVIAILYMFAGRLYDFMCKRSVFQNRECYYNLSSKSFIDMNMNNQKFIKRQNRIIELCAAFLSIYTCCKNSQPVYLRNFGSTRSTAETPIITKTESMYTPKEERINNVPKGI